MRAHRNPRVSAHERSEPSPHAQGTAHARAAGHNRLPTWQRLLQAAWMRRGPLAWALRPVAGLYAVLWALRAGLRHLGWLQTQILPVPVLVVGNVVVGGGGKTPVVIELVRHLQARGVRVGVITRGWGRQGAEVRLVRAGDDPAEVGDEPVLIAQRCAAPLAVGRDRVAAARALLAAQPNLQILISDDGLQNLALPRSLEVGVFDARGVGNGWLLPAGPLREPWPRHLDATLITHPERGIAGHLISRRLMDWAVDASGKRHPLLLAASRARAQGRQVVAWAGVAQPQAFFAMLRACGLLLDACVAWPDHAVFEPTDVAGDELIFCTEKDAVKLWRLRPDALAVGLRCDLPDTFWAWLHTHLPPHLGVQTAPPHGASAQLSSSHGHPTA